MLSLLFLMLTLTYSQLFSFYSLTVCCWDQLIVYYLRSSQLRLACPLSHHPQGLTVHCVLTSLEKFFLNSRMSLTTVPLSLNRNQGLQVPPLHCTVMLTDKPISLSDPIPAFILSFRNNVQTVVFQQANVPPLLSQQPAYQHTKQPFSTFLGKLRHCALT